MSLRRVLAATVLFLVAGCASGELTTSDPPGDGTNTPDDVQPSSPTVEPEVPPAVQPEMVYEGTYEVSSFLDVAGSGILGDKVGGALVALSEFSENPAGTILDLLAIFETPYFSQIWNILPGLIKDAIEGFLNEYFFEPVMEGVPAIDDAVGIVDDIASVSRNVELVSELELAAPDDEMHMAGHHEMRALAFSLWENRWEVAMPAEFTGLVAAEPTGTLTEVDSPNPISPDALLRLTQHAFGIPFGQMLITAINHLVFEPLGATDLRDWLGQAIDCESMASRLFGWCIGGVCMSDSLEFDALVEFCENGLDTVAGAVEGALLALNLDILNWKNWRCQMYDVGEDDPYGDYMISTLAEGRTDCQLSFVGQTFTIDAWFRGHRIAE